MAILYEVKGTMYFVNPKKNIKSFLCNTAPYLVFAENEKDAIELASNRDKLFLADDTIMEYQACSQCKDRFSKYLHCDNSWGAIRAKAMENLVGNIDALPTRVKFILY